MEQPPMKPPYHDLQASSVLIGLHWLSDVLNIYMTIVKFQKG